MSEKSDDDSNDKNNMNMIIFNGHNRDISQSSSKSQDPEIIAENKSKSLKKIKTPLIIMGNNQNGKNDIKIPNNINSPKLLGYKNLYSLQSSNKKNSQINFQDNINTFESKKLYMNKNILKIETSHLNIYEREKKNIIRKNNSIQKKKELKIQQQISNLKDPKLNEVSKNILSQTGEYIPIQERAGFIHSLHKLHIIMNDNRNKLKKMEKENEDFLEIEKYKNKNKKIFNENDWNNFIQNQEYWYKKKFLKKKAIEIMREKIEIKTKHKPKINYNSKRIVNNIRKNKEIDEDNIYDKLYNDFNYMQERKKLKICNSMPSFKPLLNKGIKKSMFKNNSNNNIYTNKNIEKQIESIIQQKLNKIKTKNNPKLLNQTFVKHLSSINFNNKRWKSPNNKNKRYEYNNKNNRSDKNKIKLLKDSYVYRKTMNKKLAKKN